MNLLITFILLILSNVSYAFALPAELMYNGKPIEAICIQEIIYNEGSIDLAKCKFSHPYMHKSNIKYDSDLIGYQYIEQGYTMQHDCYSYYSYLGNIDGKIVVYLEENSGGISHFTYILLLDRQRNNLIKSKVFYGPGDRCNGGLKSAYVKDGKINYITNTTPLDFLRIYQDNIKATSRDADESLSRLVDRSLSCYGSTKFEDDDFKYIKLNSRAEYDSYEDYDRFNAQECFDIIHKQYIDRRHITLTVTDLEKFMDEVFALYKKHHP